MNSPLTFCFGITAVPGSILPAVPPPPPPRWWNLPRGISTEFGTTLWVVVKAGIRSHPSLQLAGSAARRLGQAPYGWQPRASALGTPLCMFAAGVLGGEGSMLLGVPPLHPQLCLWGIWCPVITPVLKVVVAVHLPESMWDASGLVTAEGLRRLCHEAEVPVAVVADAHPVRLPGFCCLMVSAMLASRARSVGRCSFQVVSCRLCLSLRAWMGPGAMCASIICAHHVILCLALIGWLQAASCPVDSVTLYGA